MVGTRVRTASATQSYGTAKRLRRVTQRDQRARAALLALARRLRGDSVAARALPPFNPPLRPRSIAFGSLPAFGSGSDAMRVVRSTIILAS